MLQEAEQIIIFAACGGEYEKKFSGVRCCIPQMRGPRTPSGGLRPLHPHNLFYSCFEGFELLFLLTVLFTDLIEVFA